MTAQTNALATIKPSTHDGIRFKTAKDIEYGIESVRKMGDIWQQSVQEVQIAVLAHLDEHGDYTLFQKLHDALPKGARRNALVEHAVKYGKITVNMDDDKAKRKAKPFLFDKTKTTNLDGAAADPWWEQMPEKPVDEAFDFQKLLLALLSKADKAANDPTKNFQGRDLLEAARKLVVA